MNTLLLFNIQSDPSFLAFVEMVSLCGLFSSDLQGVRTNAKKDGSDWILNGSKVFITNGYIAGFFNLGVYLFVLCFPVTFRV